MKRLFIFLLVMYASNLFGSSGQGLPKFGPLLFAKIITTALHGKNKLGWGYKVVAHDEIKRPGHDESKAFLFLLVKDSRYKSTYYHMAIANNPVDKTLDDFKGRQFEDAALRIFEKWEKEYGSIDTIHGIYESAKLAHKIHQERLRGFGNEWPSEKACLLFYYPGTSLLANGSQLIHMIPNRRKKNQINVYEARDSGNRSDVRGSFMVKGDFGSENLEEALKGKTWQDLEFKEQGSCCLQ